ncbi:hypothetical protein ZYGR_0AI04920 [Zygosaccharomyces rouxii]|uniref:THO complex subunit THP2 n=1 Tax=Zygosaccharomyces rouxii TaxID=4956 RepID=A0A1Q3AC30_ZYGRO|nr:hypothetical protein ZYGR_0AI04920 [Zygosaccharomyces rouxii]
MSADLEFTYFDSLCEEDQALQQNYEQLQDVLQILKNLSEPGRSEEDQLQSLRNLAGSHEKLVSSSIDLRYTKYKTRESQVTSGKRFKRNENHSKLQNVQGLREYVTLVEHVNKDSLDYVNLLQRLSVDLAKQIEISDPKVSEFVVNNWSPPDDMQSILEQLADPEKDSTQLRSRLDQHLDQIKMERAKYTIENKYSLQETLNEVNKEMNYWRRNWNAIENLMFGDSAHSIKKMLQSIDLLRTKLEKPDQSGETDSNVKMNLTSNQGK